MAVNYHSQRLAGWRLFAAGSVFVEAFKPPIIYFQVKVDQEGFVKNHYLSFDLGVLEFRSICDCVSDSFWRLHKSECVHCYAVRAWLENDLISFLEEKKNEK